MGRKSDYQKGAYAQLEEVMAKVDKLEAELKQARKEIKRLNKEVDRLQTENSSLREEIATLRQENAILTEKCDVLTNENALLRDDNERMKRILNNDSSNSSIPPSQDKTIKPANTYNSRRPTNKKKGAQLGHKGHGLSKADVKEKIKKGIYVHHIEEIGTPEPNRPYVTRYMLDLEVKVVATEYRIYADDNGKFQIPDELKGDVCYGKNIKAIIALLYSEGVVANDRICMIINCLSGDNLEISTGCVYNACNTFSKKCEEACKCIKTKLLNAKEICTDATTVKTNGVQTYIRNFSTNENVLYYSSDKKDLKTLEGFDILKEYAGTLMHDHETALYHFGIEHGECNVHLERYLLKNTEETGNRWSHDLTMFLKGLNHARNELKKAGCSCFSEKQLECYSKRYDQIISYGLNANEKTEGKIAKQDEKKLLNRLVKYKKNHLLFLYDFEVHYSNNMSEKDLRICKNRQKMAGGFRTISGREMYCHIMSFVETVKRRRLNIFQSIKELMAGKPVIQ